MSAFDCSAGCGNRGSSAVETPLEASIPPEGWITIGLDIASVQPPYQFRDGRYSAVLCSTDCTITYLSRQRRVLSLAVTPDSMSSNIHVNDETRSDITRRLGALILEAIAEMPGDGCTVVIPLDKQEFQLHREVAIGLLEWKTYEDESAEDA